MGTPDPVRLRRRHRRRARRSADGRHVLRNVLLALQRLRARPRRPPVEIRRQSEGPAKPRPAVPARHRRRRRVLRPGPPAAPADPHRRARQGRVEGGDLGRGVHLHRRPDEQDQGGARPRVGGAVQPRPRPALHPAHAEKLGCDQLRRPVVRAVPRSARHRLPADVRRRPGLARADRHREHRLPGADRLAPGREHAQQPGAGVRAGDRAADPHHRRRPALLGRRQQGEVLAADQARHRSRAAARLDERAGDRRPVRPRLRRQVRPRLRQVRRRDRAVHAGVGRASRPASTPP